MNQKPRTIYIVGPTASGKTALSIELAKLLDAEIVCADSQTIRKGMDIGTAKPKPEEMDGVPHHLLNIIAPYDDYSALQFQKLAKYTVKDIHKRHKNVIIVGGTGLYIDSLFFDFNFPAISPELGRREFDAMTVEELQELIKKLELPLPTNARNKRHLVNALLRGGKSGDSSAPSPGSVIIGISPPRELLLGRIDIRVEQMFSDGFVDEVQGIIAMYGRPTREFDAIGYRIALRFIDGEITEDEAKELFKIAHRQYAKRQMSWFKRNSHIVWFESPEKAKEYILSL